MCYVLWEMGNLLKWLFVLPFEIQTQTIKMLVNSKHFLFHNGVIKYKYSLKKKRYIFDTRSWCVWSCDQYKFSQFESNSYLNLNPNSKSCGLLTRSETTFRDSGPGVITGIKNKYKNQYAIFDFTFCWAIDVDIYGI